MRAAANEVPTYEVRIEQVTGNETLDPLNISSTQPIAFVDMAQDSTTMLSQMLGEV